MKVLSRPLLRWAVFGLHPYDVNGGDDITRSGVEVFVETAPPAADEYHGILEMQKEELDVSDLCVAGGTRAALSSLGSLVSRDTNIIQGLIPVCPP